MPRIKHGQTRVEKRVIRVRKKLSGTSERPRLTIFRSQKHLYLQVINDETHQVLATASDAGKAIAIKGTKTERGIQAAQNILKKLQKTKIQKLVLDRGRYKYHGRIKAVATALREGGIEV